MRKFILSALVLFLVDMAVAQDITTVILVRHAEKGFDETGDPDLTEEGEKRAVELARVLKELSIDAIYSTPFKRTRQTVAPLAAHCKLEVKEYNPFKLDDIVSLVEKHNGETILLSGHSNTTPVVINKLIGADKYRQLDDSDYDNLYIISYIKAGESRVLSLEYGADSDL